MSKVLIAEDDAVLLRRMEKILGRYQERFELLLAGDGRAAIALLEQARVDLLVTDIQMPGIGGLELLAHVRQHHPIIPCIVMTGYGTPELRQRLPRDLLSFIEKPVDIEKLARLIIDSLEKDIPRGMIYGISVLSFLQMIQMEKKTCLFEVSAQGKTAGLLYFDKGELFDALAGRLKGEAAAVALMTEEKAAFRFRPLPPSLPKRRIHKALDLLMREATASRADLDVIDWDDLLPE